MRIRGLIIALLWIVMCSFLSGAVAIDTKTGIFHQSFKTLRTVLNGNDQAPRMMYLDSGDRLTISFDELSDSRRWMRYRLVHCDAMWRPDQLAEQMYVDGFNEAEVDDYEFSQATTVNYVHYTITVPNEKMRIKLSGNYLLQVYDEGNPDDVILQTRFMVCENNVAVNGSVTPRTDVDYEASHQQLSLSIEPKLIEVQDPYRDLTVRIVQNGREDNVSILKSPMRISGKKLYFEHQPGLIFNAGNEYRRFETVTINYPSMHVEEMSFSDPFYHATLYTDRPRSYGDYVFDKTQHGRFRVRDFDSDDGDTRAEYVLTHFTLDMPYIEGKGVFLDGDFTYRMFSPESRMVFNYNTGRYENTQLLKQGAYNYQYLTVDDGGLTGVTRLTEGDFYQTSNEYDVAVYYHRPGELYDRLVGFARLESERN